MIKHIAMPAALALGIMGDSSGGPFYTGPHAGGRARRQYSASEINKVRKNNRRGKIQKRYSYKKR